MKTTAVKYIEKQIKSINHNLQSASASDKEQLIGQKDALIKLAFSLYSVKVKDLDNLTF